MQKIRTILLALVAIALLTLLAVAAMLTLWGDGSEDPGPDTNLLFLPEDEAETEKSPEPAGQNENPSWGEQKDPAEQSAPKPQPDEGQVLVAYFSATGNTEGIATTLQTILDADLYEIVPQDPYTDEDLDYNTDGCRANREQNDPAARPAIDCGVENMEDYDVVFLGYPIWWGQAPKIISTFLESYDLQDKVIVPFCTSGSSGIGSSADNLHALAPAANWLSGQRFSGSADESIVAAWVEELNLPEISGKTNESD